MKVARADITSIVSQTCEQLQSLQLKIGENVSNVNEEDLKNIIQTLQHESNQLTREINQSKEIVPLETKLKTDLTTIIYSIRHMPTLTQALGHQQALLLGVLTRIENCIKKFETKVTKVDTDMLS